MTTVTPSRRERLRTATVAEIKDAARRLLVAGGPAAISLRAIARDMGMTAPAIYRYFPSLEALVGEICEDLTAELSEAVEAARVPVPADRPADRLTAMARAFRRWSLAHPAEFGLMFGEPVAGVPQAGEACESLASVPSFCEAFLVEFGSLWQQCRFPTPPVEVLADGFADRLAPHARELGGALSGAEANAGGGAKATDLATGLPIELIYLFVSGWIRLYGLVAMEVFGHLSWAVTDAEPLFETEIATFLRQLTGGSDRPW